MADDEYRDLLDEVREMTAVERKMTLFFLVGYCDRFGVSKAIDYAKEGRR